MWRGERNDEQTCGGFEKTDQPDGEKVLRGFE